MIALGSASGPAMAFSMIDVRLTTLVGLVHSPPKDTHTPQIVRENQKAARDKITIKTYIDADRLGNCAEKAHTFTD